MFFQFPGSSTTFASPTDGWDLFPPKSRIALPLAEGPNERDQFGGHIDETYTVSGCNLAGANSSPIYRERRRRETPHSCFTNFRCRLCLVDHARRQRESEYQIHIHQRKSNR